ncbi:hypothetical protein RFI_20365 [Reticulomyxa filosa]|uniref:Uncharacterized protein n=1 Tax=Reticulomyxa filosa TaxID=46433 RepID=X6MSN5_RETFI|nr:hypothetical protein RFI_20365 [Reticulomyxa filosa]|eukprot:ETO16973.1 hypothetical protein RFI_20365 [Reticulomyxa filosa]
MTSDVRPLLSIQQDSKLPIWERKTACCAKYPCVEKTSWALFGVFLLILGLQSLYLPSFLRKQVHHGVKESLVFKYPKPGDSSYDSWQYNRGHNRVPLWMEYRFFNVINTDEVLLGKPPRFDITPLVAYDMYEYKENVQFSTDSTTVTYDVRTFYMLPKGGEGYEDKVTLIAPFVGMLWHYYESQTYFTREQMDFIFRYLSDHPEMADDLLFVKCRAFSLFLFVVLQIRIKVQKGNTYL